MNDPVRNAECAAACALRLVHTFRRHHSARFAAKVRSGCHFCFVLTFPMVRKTTEECLTTDHNTVESRQLTLTYRSSPFQLSSFPPNPISRFSILTRLVCCFRNPADAAAAFNPKYVTT